MMINKGGWHSKTIDDFDDYNVDDNTDDDSYYFGHSSDH